MNENIFEVLIYLFENYMIDDIGSTAARADIEDELFRMGFSNYDVGSALGWLEGLLEQCTNQDQPEEDYQEKAKTPSELLANISEIEEESAVLSYPLYQAVKEKATGQRYYLQEELQRISVEVRGLLYTLEQNNMIDYKIREIIIDRIMALPIDRPLVTEKAKWIVMMVLVNCHPSNQGSSHLLDFAESFVFDSMVKH